MTIQKLFVPVRLFAPTVTSRLFDPMPLPRRRTSLRRTRMAVAAQKTTERAADASAGKSGRRFGTQGSKVFTCKVKRIPFNA